jgi:hypothetical protein
MSDESADTDLIEVPPLSWARQLRIVRSFQTRAHRLASHLSRLSRRAQPAASRFQPGPIFDVSGIRASFEELERITFDPAIIERIERRPVAALVRPSHPTPDVSRIARRMGWRPRARPARIYDVVPFGFELDMLELRLAEFDGAVDRFIVIEAERGFGGIRKPLYLRRNWPRFAPFHSAIEHEVVGTDGFDALYPGARRERTDWIGENELRARMWRHVRAAALDSDAVVIWSDVDELLPRWMIDLLKHYDCPLPMRVLAQACRYHFGWRDPEATAGITVLDARSVDQIDQNAARIRSLPARAFAARGAVHLTSFLDPAALQMKFALTTDWEPDLLRYLRNAHGETAAMMRNGTWFGRPLLPYDATRDPLRLVPFAARQNRDRFPLFWPDTFASERSRQS